MIDHTPAVSAVRQRSFARPVVGYVDVMLTGIFPSWAMQSARSELVVDGRMTAR